MAYSQKDLTYQLKREMKVLQIQNALVEKQQQQQQDNRPALRGGTPSARQNTSPNWWEKLSYERQVEYKKKNPGSKLQITAEKPQTPGLLKPFRRGGREKEAIQQIKELQKREKETREAVAEFTPLQQDLDIVKERQENLQAKIDELEGKENLSRKERKKLRGKKLAKRALEKQEQEILKKYPKEAQEKYVELKKQEADGKKARAVFRKENSIATRQEKVERGEKVREILNNSIDTHLAKKPDKDMIRQEIKKIEANLGGRLNKDQKRGIATRLNNEWQQSFRLDLNTFTKDEKDRLGNVIKPAKLNEEDMQKWFSGLLSKDDKIAQSGVFNNLEKVQATRNRLNKLQDNRRDAIEQKTDKLRKRIGEQQKKRSDDLKRKEEDKETNLKAKFREEQRLRQTNEILGLYFGDDVVEIRNETAKKLDGLLKRTSQEIKKLPLDRLDNSEDIENLSYLSDQQAMFDTAKTTRQNIIRRISANEKIVGSLNQQIESSSGKARALAVKERDKRLNNTRANINALTDLDRDISKIVKGMTNKEGKKKEIGQYEKLYEKFGGELNKNTIANKHKVVSRDDDLPTTQVRGRLSYDYTDDEKRIEAMSEEEREINETNKLRANKLNSRTVGGRSESEIDETPEEEESTSQQSRGRSRLNQNLRSQFDRARRQRQSSTSRSTQSTSSSSQSSSDIAPGEQFRNAVTSFTSSNRRDWSDNTNMRTSQAFANPNSKAGIEIKTAYRELGEDEKDAMLEVAQNIVDNESQPEDKRRNAQEWIDWAERYDGGEEVSLSFDDKNVTHKMNSLLKDMKILSLQNEIGVTQKTLELSKMKYIGKDEHRDNISKLNSMIDIINKNM